MFNTCVSLHFIIWYLILQVTHLIIEKSCHPVQLYLVVNSYPQFVFLYCCQLNVMFICILAVNVIFISQLYKCYDACMFIITISCLCNIWNCFHQCNCYFTDYCPFLALNMDRMKPQLPLTAGTFSLLYNLIMKKNVLGEGVGGS